MSIAVSIENKTHTPASYGLPSCASVLLSTLSGALLGGGLFGAVTGFATGILDEYLMHEYSVDKHYLSLGSFWASSTVYPLTKLLQKQLPGSAGILLSLGASVASLCLPYFVDDFLDFRKKLDVPIDSFNLINEMFDSNNLFSFKEALEIKQTAVKDPLAAALKIKKDLLELYNNPFFMSFIKTMSLNVMKVCGTTLFTYLLKTYSSNLFIANLLTQNKDFISSHSENISQYLKEASKILSLLFSKELFSYLVDQQLDSIAIKQYEMVLEKSTNLLIQNGNGRKIESFPRGKELIQNLTPDLTKLMYRGSNRLCRTLTESSQAILSLAVISNLASSAIAPYAALSLFYQWIVNKLSEENKKIFAKHSEGEVHFWDVKFDISNHIEQINLRDGDSFVKHQYLSLLSKQNRLNKQMEINTKTQNWAQKIMGLLRQGIDVFYYLNLIQQKRILMGEIPILHASVEDIYSFIDSNLHLEMNSNELLLAAKRLKRFFEIINSPDLYKTQRTQNKEGKMIITDYTLSVLDNPVLSIDYLEFKPGTRYAISGKSGCGKSSFLMDLKLGLLGAKSSEGKISMGCDPSEVMFINQDLYFPQDSTLFETVCFPETLSHLSQTQVAEKRKRVIELFKELEIDSFSEKGDESEGLISLLDNAEFSLSGGQKKKVAVIQAILREPPILLMDETFTGLDNHSLSLVQKALIKALPNTLVLCIDHKATDNNESEFYQSHIQFENGTAKEIPIDSR